MSMKPLATGRGGGVGGEEELCAELELDAQVWRMALGRSGLFLWLWHNVIPLAFSSGVTKTIATRLITSFLHLSS